MAKGSLMLGIEVVQVVTTGVLNVPEIWSVVFEPLDGDRTTVREIATEKVENLSGSHLERFATSTESAFTDVFLVSNDREKPLKVVHGPSFVPSPTFAGRRMVLLRVRDMGYQVVSPGSLVMARGIHAHTYVDETV